MPSRIHDRSTRQRMSSFRLMFHPHAKACSARSLAAQSQWPSTSQRTHPHKQPYALQYTPLNACHQWCRSSFQGRGYRRIGGGSFRYALEVRDNVLN